MTKSVKPIAKNRPKEIATAIGERISEPSVREIAIGNIPRQVVKVVIKIGRNRTDAPSMIA